MMLSKKVDGIIISPVNENSQNNSLIINSTIKAIITIKYQSRMALIPLRFNLGFSSVLFPTLMKKSRNSIFMY